MSNKAIALLPDYELIGRLGRGAGATISHARQVSSGRDVAIKHVIRRNPEDARFIAQAEVEYELAKTFEHPYLRQCYDLVRIRKWMKTQHLFLVMEYVEGVRLEDRRPEDFFEVLWVFRKVAEGLHALHELGYAHADIKPNNILLTKDDSVKIIDFGQSCPLGHVKQRVQGTPDYIAPEQVLRKPIDQRTDVFNLGATMYWIVTGRFFTTLIQNVQVGDKRTEIESKRGNQAPHELDESIPVGLSRLIMECCDEHPEKRPRDMKAVLSRLEVLEHVIKRRDVDADEEKPGAGSPVAGTAGENVADPADADSNAFDRSLMDTGIKEPSLAELGIPGLEDDDDTDLLDTDFADLGLPEDVDITDPDLSDADLPDSKITDSGIPDSGLQDPKS